MLSAVGDSKLAHFNDVVFPLALLEKDTGFGKASVK
jgi:hypothetical protein